MTLKILDTTVISPNHRINLTLEARKTLGVKPGDRVIVIKDNDEIKIRSA